MRLRALGGAESCFYVFNTSYGMDMRCTENISVGRQHMVEVEGGRFKCVPERLESKFILSLSGEI